MTADRLRALTAGLLYLSTHITSVVAVVAYGQATDTAVRTGALLEFMLAIGVAGTGVVLLPILAAAGPAAAHAFSSLRAVEAAIIGAGILPMLTLVDQGLVGQDNSPVGQLLLDLHQASFLVGQGLVISVNTLILGALLLRSGLVPRTIAVLGLVGGAVVLAGNLGQLFGIIDRAGTLAGISAVPIFAFEISFALYLVFRGVRTGQAAHIGL